MAENSCSSAAAIRFKSSGTVSRTPLWRDRNRSLAALFTEAICQIHVDFSGAAPQNILTLFIRSMACINPRMTMYADIQIADAATRSALSRGLLLLIRL
ncbi:hypothetical protein [Tritonibacter horizontis]|uniref:hypothetical protein n=1 Tax=Tritonibacter horizontis TaxID=1768241 RepID=UPI0010427283|nr:hypothetical protein [Tritonibacter horizontis]